MAITTQSDSLQSVAKALLNRLGDNSAVVLAGVPDLDKETKVIIIVALGSRLISLGLNAGNFIALLAQLGGGGGGGRPEFAQAGGNNPNALKGMMDFAKTELTSRLS